MKNKKYGELRNKWRGIIRQYEDRSEIVNYDEPSFPSYSYIGHMDASATWNKKVHWHQDVEFMTIISGKMAYNINGSCVELKAGDTIFVNSKQLHWTKDIDNIYCRYIITVIHPRLLISSPEVECEYVLPVISSKEIPYIIFRNGTKNAKSAAKILRELNSNNGNQFEITRCFFELWHYIFESFKKNKSDADKNSADLLGQTNFHHIESLKNMIGFIKENFAQKISLQEIADTGFMSKSTCNSVFKKYTGHTPSDYLIRHRIDRAQELLLSTDQTISQISAKCGFCSPSYMTEQFVRCCNSTPSEFRKKRE